MCCSEKLGEMRYCTPCLKTIGKEHDAYNDDDAVGTCPRCRTVFVVTENDGTSDAGTIVTQRDDRHGQCMMCMQQHKLVQGEPYCAPCLFGQKYNLRYECSKCHRSTRIPYPLWISQANADSYSGSSWYCHVGCYDYTHWRVHLDDLRDKVPMKHWPSWYVIQYSMENSVEKDVIPTTKGNKITGSDTVQMQTKNRKKGISFNNQLESPPDNLYVDLLFDKDRCIIPSWMTLEKKDLAIERTKPLPKGCQVWYIAFEGKYDWFVRAKISDFFLNGDEVVAYVLTLDDTPIKKNSTSSNEDEMRRWEALQHKVEKELKRVHPSKVTLRWDEIVPISPMENSEHIGVQKKNLSYGGVDQNGVGPEYWGITLEQMKEVINHKSFRRNVYVYGKNVTKGFSMYDVVKRIVNPMTKGKGMGYALMMNQDKPLKAKIMISHAWQEDYESFVEAIEDSGEEGPFWVCAFGIYQPEDIPELTIAMQLGASPERGPFAIVLQHVLKMLGIVTRSCDIYTRLWCVYEIFVAISYGVPIDIVYTSEKGEGQSLGSVYLNAGLELSNVAIATEKAICSNESDANMIKKEVHSLEGGFSFLNTVICWIKALSLIKAHDEMIGAEKSREVPFGVCTTSCAQARLNAGIAAVISQLTVDAPIMMMEEHPSLEEGVYTIKTTEHESTGMVANRGLSVLRKDKRNNKSSWVSVYEGDEWTCDWEVKKGIVPGTYQINTKGHEIGEQEAGWGLCAHYNSSKRDRNSTRVCAHFYDSRGYSPNGWTIVPGNKDGTWRILTTESFQDGQPKGWGLSAWGPKVLDGIQNEDSSWVYVHSENDLQMDWIFEKQESYKSSIEN